MPSRRGFLFTALALITGRAAAQDQAATVRPFSVAARRYAFDPRRIEVNQDDLVRIDLSTQDIAHSMTIDGYRIAKRVNPGTPVTFEFRADRPGTFPYYCNLQIEDGCRQMRGELVVRPRRAQSGIGAEGLGGGDPFGDRRVTVEQPFDYL